MITFKDSVNEQQRSGQIMPRYAPDELEQQDGTVAWEVVAGLDVVPRRSPWKTAGQDDENLFATVSDKYVPITRDNVAAITISSGQSSAPRTSIKICTRVYVSGNSILAEYKTYAIDARLQGISTETVIVGATCSG
jgi:hypothetical protein